MGQLNETAQSTNDMISRQAAIDALNVGAKLLKRVLDDADVVGAEREKYEWGLWLIESYISDMKELPSTQPETSLMTVTVAPDSEEIERVVRKIKDAPVMVLPSAQPEIIRCKDCKHWTNNIGDSKLRDNYCNDEAHGFYYQCSEDDYCSFAERRTDEQTVS